MNALRQFFVHSNGAWVASLTAVICFLAGIAVTAHVGYTVRSEIMSQNKRQAVANLSEVRAKLEGELNRTVAYGIGLRANVIESSNKPFNARKYDAIASDLIDENPVIRSMGLAPDNVLQAVYPYQPNQSAIGLDYRLNTSQWPAIRQAMLSREIVIAGPLELVQGGRALLIRIPVFPPSELGQPMPERPYWGVLSLVVDEAGLMQAAGISDTVKQLRIGIVDKAAATPEKAHIFGSFGLMDIDSVRLPLNLPGGLTWEVLGYPENGWNSNERSIWITQLVGSLISLLFGAMAFLLISEVYKVRSMALHDPLTGLANRRLLEDRMLQLAVMSDRTGSGFEIFYVDLDAFKPINDNYGHAAGDQLLVEIGHRLQQQTRQTDTVARVGGDEFIVLTPGNMRRLEREAFLERLGERLSEVFEFSGVRIGVSASIGSASFPSDAGTIDDLLRVADSRMYSQKTKGRQKPETVSGNELPQTG